MTQAAQADHDSHSITNLLLHDDYFHLLVEDYKNLKQFLVRTFGLHSSPQSFLQKG